MVDAPGFPPGCELEQPRTRLVLLPEMEIPPTHFPASRAASVAENCINYQQGTPHKVFLVQTVKQASMEVSLMSGTGTHFRSL